MTELLKGQLSTLLSHKRDYFPLFTRNTSSNIPTLITPFQFIIAQDLDDKHDDADDEPFPLTSISQASRTRPAQFAHKIATGIKKTIGTSILRDESSDIPSHDGYLLDNSYHEDILPRGNMGAHSKLLANQDHEVAESAPVDEETENHGDRVKRDLTGTSSLNPYKGSISEHLLKLSGGNKMLRPEKATVAEALNGAAIRKILERARAAKVNSPYKDLYNGNNFGKWFLPGSSFSTDIFHQPHQRSSPGTEVNEHSEDTDDSRHRTFSTLHNRVSHPTNHYRRHYYYHPRRHYRRHRGGEHAFGTLPEPRAADTTSTEHSYAKLLHKSRRQGRLSPKLQITSEEKRSPDEGDGMIGKPTTVLRQAHRSLYEDDIAGDDGGLQYYSHAYAPRLRENDDAENGKTPKWEHARWTRRFGARDFDSSRDLADYRERYMFGSAFDGSDDENGDDERGRVGRREGHRVPSVEDENFIVGIHDGINRNSPTADEETKSTTSDSYAKANWQDVVNHERYYYDIGDQEDSIYDGEAVALGHGKNRHLADFLVGRTSSLDSQIREGNIRAENKRVDGAGRSLTAEIPPDAFTREVADIDMKHYRSRDRNAAANSMGSFSSGSSSEKDDAFASLSIDDESTKGREVAESASYGALRRTRPVIDNDATTAELGMGFSGMKSHQRADLPWAHSSPSRESSRTHLGNQGAHRGYESATADGAVALTGTERWMDDDEDAPLVKTRKDLSVADLRSDEGLNDDAESSADDPSEEDYAGIWEGHMGSNEGRRGRQETSTGAIDFPDREDKMYFSIPEIPIYKFRRGFWPYEYYAFPSSEGMSGDQGIQGESGEDWGEDEVDYDPWNQKEEFSTDDEDESTMQARYVQLNRYDLQSFNEFLRNMTWSSSIMSSISEYEVWERYVMYLYYLWRQGKLEASNAAETSEEEDIAMDDEISLDRRGRKHTADEDNYIHLRKQKKWPQRAGKFIIRNTSGSTRHGNKLVEINSGRTSSDDDEDDDEEVMSEGDDQKENHEAFVRAGNVIREDSTIDMSEASSANRIMDNNRYYQQDSGNSMSLENSYTDSWMKTDGYDFHRRNKKVGIDRAAETTESSNSENNLRPASTETSPASRSYAQMNERNVNKSNGIKKTATQASNKEAEYQGEADSSVTSSATTDESQIRRMYYLWKKSRIDRKNSARRTETTESSATMEESQSNVRDTEAASKLSGRSQAGSERYSNNLEDRERSTNATASADAISMQDKRAGSISEDASSTTESSMRSETETENYSREGMGNVEKSITNSEASSASSAESLARSKGRTDRARNNSKSVRTNADGKTSSTATFSDNSRDEWSSSTRSTVESRLKSGYYSTNYKSGRVNAISRSSADSTLSGAVKDERRSHSQKSSSSSSSTSSGKLQTEFQRDSNSIQNSQINVAESSVTSASLDNTVGEHWTDSKSSSSESLVSLEEVHQDNSKDLIEMQESNTEERSELEKSSSLKSRVKSSDELYLSVAEDNENNVVGAGASKTTSSAGYQSMNSLSASYSSAESQVKNGNSRKETSMSSTTSSALRGLSSSQTASKGNLQTQQEDPRTINKSTALENNDDERRQENNVRKETFIDPKSDLETSNEVIQKDEISHNSLNAATSTATAATSTDIKNVQNSITTSTSIDSKAGTRIHSENQLREGGAVLGDSIISATSATSQSEIGDGSKNKLLRTSSQSESRGISATERRRDMNTAKSSQESTAAAKESSESTISTLSASSKEEAQQKSKNLHVSREDSKDTTDKTTLVTTSSDVNEYQDDILKGISSDVSYKKLQTANKLSGKDEASAEDSTRTSGSAIVRNNEHERLRSVLSYDYRRKLRGDVEYVKHASDRNKMTSTGSVTSSTVSDHASRDHSLGVGSLDHLHAESSQEDDDKSNIHSGADETARTGIISHDDKQARGNVLRKLMLLNNPSDEERMIIKRLLAANGNRDSEEDNSWRMSSSDGSQVTIEGAGSTANERNDAADSFALTDAVNDNFQSDYQDDPSTMLVANVQDGDQLESSSIDTKAQSVTNQKSSVSRASAINTETRHKYGVAKRTKYRTASSSSHLETKTSMESTSSEIDENSRRSSSTRGESSSVSSDSHNYSDRRRADMGDAAGVKESAETSISNVSPIERQEDAKEKAISQLKRHDSNVRDGDKGIASDVLQSAGGTKLGGMQDTQQLQSSESIESFQSRTKAQRMEDIGDVAKKDWKAAASATTTARGTTSSQTVQGESRQKLTGVSSTSDSYSKSRRGSERSSESRQEQMIVNTKVLANSALSSDLAESDWVREKDSLGDLSRNTYAEVGDENALENKLANVAEATLSAQEETSYNGVVKDKRQSGVTALLSNAAAQERNDYNSGLQRGSTESSSDTKDRVLKTEDIANDVEANVKAAASGVHDSSGTTSSSANQYVGSRVDITQMTVPGENTQAISENTNGITKDSSAIVNARAETATSRDTKDADSYDSITEFNLLNAAENSRESTGAGLPATLLTSADADEDYTGNFMREKFNVDPQIQGMMETTNNGNMLRNTEASGQETSFNDDRNEFEDESRVFQNQRLIAVDPTASSVSETFGHADSMQINDPEESTATSSSDSYEGSSVRNENRASVLAENILGASASTQTMTFDEFRDMNRSLRTTLSSNANANAQMMDTNGITKDPNARAEIVTSTDTDTDSHDLLDLLNEDSGETTRAEASATSLVSDDAQGEYADNFMGGKSNAGSQIQGMSESENNGDMLQSDPRNGGNAEASARATSFGNNAKNKLEGGDKQESGVLQKRRLISMDPSVPKIFDDADSMQINDPRESAATLSSDSSEESSVESENRASVSAKDRTDVFSASASSMMTSDEFTGKDKSLGSDVYANTQAIVGSTNDAGKDSNTVASARTKTATSADIKGAHGLFDLLTGAVTRMRTKGAAVFQEGAIKEDISGTRSDMLSETGVEKAAAGISGGNYRKSVNAIVETGSGDQRGGDSREMAFSFSDVQDSQRDAMKSTSSVNSYTEARTTSDVIAQEDSGVNILTLRAAAERKAQNKFNALRKVEEDNYGEIGGESGEYQDGSNVATSGVSTATITSTEMEDNGESESVSSNEMTELLFNKANAETRVRTQGKSSVASNPQSPVDIEETRSSTTFAASSASASTFDSLGVNNRARYHRIGNGMSTIASASKEMRHPSGETTAFYSPRGIGKCDENVETREFIREATSLYQVNKERNINVLVIYLKRGREHNK